MTECGVGDYQVPERMKLKEQAIPLPDLEGKSVLDVGCDHGHWCWLAAERGAAKVVGLDRNRKVKGQFVDVIQRNRAKSRAMEVQCNFHEINIGRQWREYGKFDVVLCLSMYHYIYKNCGSHESAWFWLWRHTACDGELLWENPTGEDDGVVLRLGVQPYRREEILEAAERHFEVEVIGPALHVKTREVWRCKPRPFEIQRHGKITHCGGGATKAFNYAGGRRIDELEYALGFRFFPGSLNVMLDYPFDWDTRYYRVQILDVIDRAAGLDSPWAPRWVRLYPVMTGPWLSYVMRFEGERYDDNFIELICEEELEPEFPDGRIDVRSC